MYVKNLMIEYDLRFKVMFTPKFLIQLLNGHMSHRINYTSLTHRVADSICNNTWTVFSSQSQDELHQFDTGKPTADVINICAVYSCIRLHLTLCP